MGNQVNTLEEQVTALENEVSSLESMAALEPHANFTNHITLESVDGGISVASVTNKSINSVSIPDYITEIKDYAFASCYSLAQVLFLGNSKLTNIGAEAFYRCAKLTNINIPEGVTSIGRQTFAYCGLTSIAIPDSVASIDRSAFVGCNSLTSITIGANNPVYHSNNNCVIKTADKLLVCGCASSVIPSDGSVTSISEYAFSDHSGLVSINIPNCITRIQVNAFRGCSNLTSIAFDGTKAQWKAITKDEYWDNQTPDYIITCTDGTIAKDGTET